MELFIISTPAEIVSLKKQFSLINFPLLRTLNLISQRTIGKRPSSEFNEPSYLGHRLYLYTIRIFPYALALNRFLSSSNTTLFTLIQRAFQPLLVSISGTQEFIAYVSAFRSSIIWVCSCTILKGRICDVPSRCQYLSRLDKSWVQSGLNVL